MAKRWGLYSLAHPSLARRTVGEALGAFLLLLAIVGSGVAADRLTDQPALTLLIHALVVGLALAVAITAVGPISGGHLNPVVSVAVALQGGLAWRDVPMYVGAQLAGALAGVVAANVMFELPAVAIATTSRAGAALWLSEVLATFGLLTVIWGATRLHAGAMAAVAVGAYVTAAIVFASSTAFANPAVTLSRMFTDTFTGIAPVDTAPFVLAQLLGAIAATMLFRWLVPAIPQVAAEAVVPQERTAARP